MLDAAGSKCEISRQNHTPLECSHSYHQRGEHYNNPLIGTVLKPQIHLMYHRDFADEPEIIGLSYYDNQFAMESIQDRIYSWEEARGYEHQPIDERVARAWRDSLITLIGRRVTRLGYANPYAVLYGEAEVTAVADANRQRIEQARISLGAGGVRRI